MAHHFDEHAPSPEETEALRRRNEEARDRQEEALPVKEGMRAFSRAMEKLSTLTPEERLPSLQRQFEVVNIDDLERVIALLQAAHDIKMKE